MTHFKVHILGNGGAAKKHREAFSLLPDKFQLTEDYHNADIIDICTPNYLHFTQIMCALNCYKSVFVEKPMCGSLAEMDIIENKLSNSFIPVGLLPIFQHRIREANQITRIYYRDHSYYNGWRGKWETALGGVLISHAIHDLHAIAVRSAQDFDIDTVRCEVEEFGKNGLESRVNITLEAAEREPIELCIGITSVPSEETNPLKSSVDDYMLQFDKTLDGTVLWNEAQLTMELVTACYQSIFYGGGPVHLPDLQMSPKTPFYSGWTQPILRRQRSMESFQKISA